jgi:membrane-bound lytic murein transglycosylase B
MPALLPLLLAGATLGPPAPSAPLAHAPAPLAADLATTIRELRADEARWDGHSPVPRDITLLALHHQRLLRRMTADRRLGDATLRALPRDVRGEARDTVRARRALAAIPRSPGPPVKVGPAAPAARLRRYYALAQRRYGVPWTTLAAVNLVESEFGRLRNASESGARGPMQFMPATWGEYGAGGDITDPHDAILAAARLLRANGGSLYAYNHSLDYVRAVRTFASRMRADPRTFKTYYAWQVYSHGRRLTGPR